jgi:hypothetical protein
MIDSNLRIMCQKCGKLKPAQGFNKNWQAQICDVCFEPPTETITDIAKHIQSLYEKKLSILTTRDQVPD